MNISVFIIECIIMAVLFGIRDAVYQSPDLYQRLKH